MQSRKREDLQVPSGFESVASIQGITRILGRACKYRESGSGKRSLVNGVRGEGLEAVGLSHSSEEARESAWSEGDNKATFTLRKH